MSCTMDVMPEVELGVVSTSRIFWPVSAMMSAVVDYLAKEKDSDLIVHGIRFLEAAKGVSFLAPLKPKLPALDQNKALPNLSAKSAFVLLKVASTCKTPEVTFFFGVLEGAFFSSAPASSFFSISFVVLSFAIINRF